VKTCRGVALAKTDPPAPLNVCNTSGADLTGVSKKKMTFDLYDARFEKYATNQHRPSEHKFHQKSQTKTPLRVMKELSNEIK